MLCDVIKPTVKKAVLPPGGGGAKKPLPIVRKPTSIPSSDNNTPTLQGKDLPTFRNQPYTMRR
jgi:hypothetical protein